MCICRLFSEATECCPTKTPIRGRNHSQQDLETGRIGGRSRVGTDGSACRRRAALIPDTRSRNPPKPDQVNTPISKSLATPETVTIVDPRHPLHDQTFPLLHVKDHRNLIPSCLIQVLEGVDRLVPVSSLQNLIQTFACIQEQVESECGDENTKDPEPNTASDQSQAGMANTGGSAAENSLSDRCSNLQQPDPGQNPGGIR
jgi:hypothetical protein